MKRLLQTGIVILTLVSILITILPLLNGNYFSMHDRQHVVRLYLLDTAIHQGYWFPRWVDGLGFGFGYALFNFYPPLVYYVSMLFRIVGFGYIWSLKLMLASGFIISFFGMFLLVKRLTRNGFIGLLAGQLYLLAQYHSELVYVRGAFAEFFGYNLLPWAFYGFVILAEKGQVVWFAAAFALLMLAHPFVAFPFVIMFLIFFAVYIFFRTDRKRVFLNTFLGSLWGLGLSAFFWLPSMFERSATLVDQILTKQMADFKQHFVYIRQLISSPWGYGGSIPGPQDGLSFEIGKVHLLLVLIGIAVLAYFLYKKNRKMRDKLVTYVPFILGSFAAIYMMLFKSQFIWERISLLWYLQFPWRFLGFAAFFSTVGGIGWLVLVRKNVQLAVILGLMSVTYLLYAPVFKPEKFIAGTDAGYLTRHQIRWEQSKTSFEFMNKNVRTYAKNDAVYFVLTERDLPNSLFTLSDAGARGSVIDDLFRSKSISVTARMGTDLTLNRSFFPGWKAYVDHAEVAIRPQDPAQTMMIRIPQGNHLVEFEFMDTPIRILGWLLTAGALVLLFQPKKIYNTLVSGTRKAANKS